MSCVIYSKVSDLVQDFFSFSSPVLDFWKSFNSDQVRKPRSVAIDFLFNVNKKLKIIMND